MKIPQRFFFGVVLIASLMSNVAAFAASYPEFASLVEEKSPAVVKITSEVNSNRYSQPQSTGSGFLVSEDGYVLTNNHVVNGAVGITVRLIDRREYRAEIVGLDPQSDLALLKIDEDDLPYLTFADSDKAKVGEWVLAIGSPFGLDYSVSAGIISAIGRSIRSESPQNYVPFIQTDVAINPGNSGGPLFNLDGDVVGINSQILTRSGGSIGLSFAIPSNLARDVIAQLKNKGKVDRGWLGVTIQDVDRDLAISFGLDKPQGALIAQLEHEGPADKSGLEVGDIILKFNGRDISTSSDLLYAVGPTRAGSTVPVDIIRKGEKLTIDVTVGVRDGQASLSDSGSVVAPETRLGLMVDPLTAEAEKSLGLKGVVITQVLPNSPADKAGLAPGDVLVQLGFDEVKSVKDFRKIEEALPVNKPQPIRVIRQGRPLFRSIVIDE